MNSSRMTFPTKALLFIVLALPSWLLAVSPSDQLLRQVESSVQALFENPDSEKDLDVIKKALQAVMREDGMRGIAWLAYQHPVMLESFVTPESMGLENIAVSLLSLAESEGQMKAMLMALVGAQMGADLDPFAEEHMAILTRGCLESSAGIDQARVEQMISEVLVSAMESEELEVEAATYGYKYYYKWDYCKYKYIKVGYYCYIPKYHKCKSWLKPHHYKDKKKKKKKDKKDDDDDDDWWDD